MFSCLSGKTPIWFMRQAGRYLPEYLQIKSKFDDFFHMCGNAEAVTEITLQPLKRFDLDAAIIFSDILVINKALGQQVYMNQQGPILESIDVLKLIDTNNEDFYEKFLNVFSPTCQGIKFVRRYLNENKSLIGFVGAPWTLITYMIEGKSSKQFNLVKNFALGNDIIFQKLIDKVIHCCIFFLKEQIKSGVDVIQIFDSWAGVVPESYVKSWIFDPINVIVNSIKEFYPKVKVIVFIKGQENNIHHLTGKADAVSVGSVLNRKYLKNIIGGKFVIQGNLDPNILCMGGKDMEVEVMKIMEDFEDTPHIFNLSHGVIPQTPVENIHKVVDLVKNYVKSK